ncbi:hypothetical protein ACSBPU_12975 [Parapusillimonas sp. JC17]|uniref:hypothetical protein n=1 Tax=Parapusillimonas sp. JC17 TaxID=3445768 RepID=UPI003FA12228
MRPSIKHQIEYAIEANAKNAKTLVSMLELYGKLEPEGWTPRIYDQCIRELYRVQMCVVHRGLINDLFRLADQVNADDLPDRRYTYDDDGDGPEFARQDLQRIKDALQAALDGLPPT